MKQEGNKESRSRGRAVWNATEKWSQQVKENQSLAVETGDLWWPGYRVRSWTGMTWQGNEGSEFDKVFDNPSGMENKKWLGRITLGHNPRPPCLLPTSSTLHWVQFWFGKLWRFHEYGFLCVKIIKRKEKKCKLFYILYMIFNTLSFNQLWQWQRKILAKKW